MKKPNFFIIGAPKCGTTAMAWYLSQHPEVFVTTPKEPHHHNTDLNHGSYKEKERYLSLFSDAKEGHKAVGEASVWYLYSKEAIGNILKELPDAKFVVMLRNPLDMAPSLHKQLLFSGAEDVRSFVDAWSLQELRRDGKQIPRWSLEPSFLQYRDVCSLGIQYQRLCEQVEPSQLITIVHDDFKSNPRKVWLELLEFLEVLDDGRIDFPVVNAAKSRRSYLAKHINDIYATIRHQFGIPGLSTGIFTRIDRWNSKTHAREPLPENMIEVMKVEFEEDVSRLSMLLNRDLSHWIA